MTTDQSGDAVITSNGVILADPSNIGIECPPNTFPAGIGRNGKWESCMTLSGEKVAALEPPDHSCGFVLMIVVVLLVFVLAVSALAKMAK